MAETESKVSYVPILGLMAAGVVIALILFAVARGKSGGPEGKPPLDTRQANSWTNSMGHPSGKRTTAWAEFPTFPNILIKASEAKSVEGEMVLGRGSDNKGVTDAEGRPAEVDFVWVEGGGEEHATREGRALFQLDVPEAATYYPWARVCWEDGCGNSMKIVFERDGVRQDFVIEDSTHSWWHWLPVSGKDGLELEKGAYILRVENREDGARLSRILLSRRNHKEYKPETPDG